MLRDRYNHVRDASIVMSSDESSEQQQQILLDANTGGRQEQVVQRLVPLGSRRQERTEQPHTLRPRSRRSQIRLL